MSADTEGQGPGLVLPEGYVAEQYEDGRLRIYDNDTGSWLGEIAPHLANAQEVAQDLITAHEQSEAARDNLTVLGADESVLYRIDEHREVHVPETRDESAGRFSGDETGVESLRIRELEIVAGLAEEALRRGGDDATAEIVRAVLVNKPEQPYSS